MPVSGPDDLDGDGVLNEDDACPDTQNRLDHVNIAEYVTSDGCYDEDLDGIYARDIRVYDFDFDGDHDFNDGEESVLYDNCYATENADQADGDGFNDGETLGDACEDMKFTVERGTSEETLNFEVYITCLENDIFDGDCSFKFEFDEDLTECPGAYFLMEGEITEPVSRGARYCEYTLRESIDWYLLEFDFGPGLESLTASLAGDVRNPRFTNVKTVERFGDLNYFDLYESFYENFLWRVLLENLVLEMLQI